LTDYYKHPQMADGHLNKCKTCCKRQAEERRQRLEQDPEWMAKEAARHREKTVRYIKEGRHNPDPARRLEACQKWRRRNREKMRAHGAVGKAIQSGRLVKGSCEKCGTTVGVHAHHDDYTKPMEVRWLCSAHHREHHRKYK
jgi:hypothetical protein